MGRRTGQRGRWVTPGRRDRSSLGRAGQLVEGRVGWSGFWRRAGVPARPAVRAGHCGLAWLTRCWATSRRRGRAGSPSALAGHTGNADWSPGARGYRPRGLVRGRRGQARRATTRSPGGRPRARRRAGGRVSPWHMAILPHPLEIPRVPGAVLRRRFARRRLGDTPWFRWLLDLLNSMGAAISVTNGSRNSARTLRLARAVGDERQLGSPLRGTACARHRGCDCGRATDGAAAAGNGISDLRFNESEPLDTTPRGGRQTPSWAMPTSRPPLPPGAN